VNYIKYSKMMISVFLLIVLSISVSAFWEVVFSNTLDNYPDSFTAGTKEGASDGHDGLDVLQQPATPSGAYIQMRTRVDDKSLTKDYMAELVVGVAKTWEIRKLINGIVEEDEIDEEDILTWDYTGVPSDIGLILIDYGTDSSRTTIVETIDLRGEDYYSFDVSKTGPGTFRYIDFVATKTEGECVEEWNCTDWSGCSGGTQTKECFDANDCGTEDDKPETSQSCSSGDTGNSGGSGGSRTYTPPVCNAEWECEAWSLCSEEGKQVRLCAEKTTCGTGKPVDKRNCYYYREKEEVVIEDEIPELISEEIIEDKMNTDTESLDKVTGFAFLNLENASPLIGIVVMVVILIVGLGAYFYIKKN